MIHLVIAATKPQLGDPVVCICNGKSYLYCEPQVSFKFNQQCPECLAAWEKMINDPHKQSRLAEEAMKFHSIYIEEEVPQK